MDTITTTQDLLKFNGSARPVTVALTPNETRLIAAAPALVASHAALTRVLELVYANAGESPEWLRNRIDAALSDARNLSAGMEGGTR